MFGNCKVKCGFKLGIENFNFGASRCVWRFPDRVKLGKSIARHINAAVIIPLMNRRIYQLYCPDSRRTPHHQFIFIIMPYIRNLRSALASNLCMLVLRILIFSSAIFAVSLIRFNIDCMSEKNDLASIYHPYSLGFPIYLADRMPFFFTICWFLHHYIKDTVKEEW